MKNIALIFLFLLLIPRLVMSITVGLDSGHSIKELYKSGNAFVTRLIVNGEEVTRPYYSVAWPAGGLKVVTSDGYNVASAFIGQLGDPRTYASMADSVSFPNWRDASGAFRSGGR